MLSIPDQPVIKQKITMNMHFFSGSPPVCQMGQRVMVVGGGLTSAHIIAIALKQGACHVTWVLRKHLQVN